MNNHLTRGRAFEKWTRSETLKATKKRLDSKNVWTEKEREKKREARKASKGGRKTNTKHSKDSSVKHETSPVGDHH